MTSCSDWSFGVLAGLDVGVDDRLEELQGALVVALQVVRLADDDVDLLVAQSRP